MAILKNLVILLLLVLSLVSGRATFREMAVGSGSRDSTTALAGDSREMAFVANAVAGTVSVIDIERRAVVATLDVTPDGKRVAPARNLSQWYAQPKLEAAGGLNYAQDTDLSRDGRVLFVSRGFLGDVAAFDLATGELIWRAPVPGLRADHMALSPDGQTLFVAATLRGGNKVQALESSTGLRRWSFEAGVWPHDVQVSTDGRRVYAGSLGDMQKPLKARGEEPGAYRITVADAQDETVLRHLDMPAGVRPFAIAADQRRVYAQLSNAHGVSVFDLEEAAPVASLTLPQAEGISEADWDFEAPHHGLALAPDRQKLCVAGRASDYAAVLAAAPLSVSAIVPVGDAPSWAAVTEDGALCLVANNRSDDVSLVSMDEGRELARIAVGRAPKHITVGRVPRRLFEDAASGD